MFDAEETSLLMDRPPGGWSDLVTIQVLDAKLDALRSDLRAELAEMRTEIGGFRGELTALGAAVDRRLRIQTWVTTTALVSGIGVTTAISTTVALLG